MPAYSALARLAGGLIAGLVVLLARPPGALVLAGLIALLVASAHPPLIATGLLAALGALALGHTVFAPALIVAAELAFDGRSARVDRALVVIRVRHVLFVALGTAAVTAMCLSLQGTATRTEPLVAAAALAAGGLAVLLARLAR